MKRGVVSVAKAAHLYGVCATRLSETPADVSAQIKDRPGKEE